MSFFVLPTRLADGLEAKKSSPVFQMRPRFAYRKTLVPPCCSFLQLRQFDLSKFIGKIAGKARCLTERSWVSLKTISIICSSSRTLRALRENLLRSTENFTQSSQRSRRKTWTSILSAHSRASMLPLGPRAHAISVASADSAHEFSMPRERPRRSRATCRAAHRRSQCGVPGPG